MPALPRSAVVAGLAALGVAARLPIVLARPDPWDWDPAYYRVVARNIAAGRGAVVDGITHLTAPAPGATGPADLYWQPLPSRILVPEHLLAPTEGLVTVLLLGALLGPLAHALAQRAGLTGAAPVVAGVLAAVGGAWCRVLASTDVHVSTAILGGTGLLAVARARWAVAAVMAAGLGLTRNDGFLAGACLALGFRGRRAMAVAAAGPAAAAVWVLRNHLVAGERFWRGRRAATEALSYVEIFLGRDASPTLLERLQATLGSWDAVLLLWGWATLGVGLPFLVAGIWQLRRQRFVAAFAAGVLLLPVAVALLAPATADGGTLQRTGAAFLVGYAVLIAAGLEALVRWARERRELAPAFTRGVALTVGLGLAGWWTVSMVRWQRPPPDCAAWEAVPAGRLAFVADPPVHDAVCGRPGVLLVDAVPPAQAREVGERFQVCHAVLRPTRDGSPPDAPEPIAHWPAPQPLLRVHPAWDGTGCDGPTPAPSPAGDPGGGP
jgi:hypothetical protein